MEFADSIIGFGASDADLDRTQFRRLLEEALESLSNGERVLAIIPDNTRDDNTAELFPIVTQILHKKGIGKFDALVAQGTHIPMTEAKKKAKIGWNESKIFSLLENIYDHRWNTTEELLKLGDLTSAQVIELTGGLLTEPVSVTLNKLLAPGLYDTILIFGATVPHEIAGFAGGAKYFFPGVAGPDLTHATHWLGALASIEKIIGRIETPTRKMIEAAADFVAARVISINSVVSRESDNRLRTHALFCGDVRAAFRAAASINRLVHIKYTGRKYKRVVALLDEHYDELWVGGKASYKLGGIIEEGGELIIYAPHLHSVSETHGLLIEKYGYAPIDKVREMVALSTELQSNLAVAAHLAHVSYAGRRDPNGKIIPRFQIVLASALDENVCRRINLGFMDYRQFNLKDYTNKPDTLIVKRAGRDLYLVDPID